MKRTVTIVIVIVLAMALSATAFANDYEFSTGGETIAGFGKATSNDDPVAPDPMSENIRRNKDAAMLPPPYFYGSGDIPTDPSSQYQDNLPSSGGVAQGGTTWVPGVTAPPSGFESSTSLIVQSTEPRYYADGSIGTLYVARTGRTIKVYHGEQLSNLNKGAGHFVSTSAWDGNVGLCGHNRGSAGYFSFVKDMQIGDRVTYTTQYGTRTYEVFSKERIGEYDHSKLGWSAENILTLITCIENSPDLRWAATLREVR